MKPFLPDHRCGDCLRGLAENAVRLAGGGKESSQVDDTRMRAFELIEEGLAQGSASPVIANRMLREITSRLGTEDPYADFKVNELKRAGSVFNSITPYIKHDFRSLVGLAALGNTLDFFRDTEAVMREVPALLQESIKFARDDIDRLERFLDKGSRKVLYLTDNAGEIYFDLLLYEALSRRSAYCTLVLKGGAALNDLTREELRLSGLAERFPDVTDTGTGGAGIDWERVSPEFLSRVLEADLILSKGMANFETVYPRSLSASSFYLFRVKCEPIQDAVGIQAGGFAAFWKDGAPGDPGPGNRGV
ncbi:MAG: damage-control phosphatase ARMT1 family protein [Thermodesulfobacteriota bacterium]